MCEKKLYKKLESNSKDIERLNGEYFLVAENIKLKMKLLDTKIIKGVYLDWSKNIGAKSYNVTDDKDKTVYQKKVQMGTGGINFE